MQEILSQRGESYKIYDLGGNQRKYEAHCKPIHFKGNWSDPEAKWQNVNEKSTKDFADYILYDKLPYILKTYKHKVGYEIESRKTGHKYSIELDSSVDIANIRFEFDINSKRVRLWKTLNAGAPTTLKWKVTEAKPEWKPIILSLDGNVPNTDLLQARYQDDKAFAGSLAFDEKVEAFDELSKEVVEITTEKVVIDDNSFEWIETAPKTGVKIDTDVSYYGTEYKDGYITHNDTVWATVRSAVTGTNAYFNVGNNAFAVRADYSSPTYTLNRAFFYFDTSGIPSGAVVGRAVVNIYGFTNNDDGMTIQQGTQQDSPDTSDFDSFSGNYFALLNSWNTAAYNEFALNNSGLDAINKGVGAVTKYCLRNYERDYSDLAPTVSNRNGCYFSLETGTDKDPKLEITYTEYPEYALESTNKSSALARGNQRNFARQSDGTLWCCYIKDIGAPNYDEGVYIKKSTDDGQTWSGEETVETDVTYNVGSSSIAVDSDDNLHVVWEQKTSTYTADNQIRYRKRNSGGSWGSVYEITAEAYDQFSPSICIDSNDVINIIWCGQHSGSTTYYQIRHRRYTTSWQTIANITSANYNQYFPSGAIDSSNNFHAVWKGYTATRSAYYQIRYAKWTSSWSGITEITDEDYTHADPCIAIDSNDYLHLAWSANNADTATYRGIFYRKYTTSWQTEVEIYIEENTPAHQDYPSITLDQADNVYVFWEGNFLGSTNDALCMKLWNGSSWGNAIRIRVPTVSSAFPSALFARWPVVDGLKTNIPVVGFIIGHVASTSLKAMISDDLEFSDINELEGQADGISSTTGALTLIYAQDCSGSFDFTGSLLKETHKNVSGQMSFGATLYKITQINLSGQMDFTGNMTYLILRGFLALSGTLAFTGNLQATKMIFYKITEIVIATAKGLIDKIKARKLT